MTGRARKTLGSTLKERRNVRRLSLRDVERRTGIKSGHLSQIESGTIAKPEMAILWDLAELYGLDFAALLSLAGLTQPVESAGRARQRMTVALRALEELSPEEQAATLAFIADLKAQRDRP
jgi:HTH-type transcriptional regulator, competence development regulator